MLDPPSHCVLRRGEHPPWHCVLRGGEKRRIRAHSKGFARFGSGCRSREAYGVRAYSAAFTDATSATNGFNRIRKKARACKGSRL
jgi:hypothetical protein